MLDGLERFGKAVSLADVSAMQLELDVMVTGALSVDCNGSIIGTGSGCFNLARAILVTASLANEETPSIAVVHDCQVLEEEHHCEAYHDRPCDTVITPSRTLTFGK